MITYNHERYISQAIEGVLNQKTDFPIELVVGEDCSTDSTRDICLEYEKNHPEIVKVVARESNLGIMPNFVDSLKRCRGKYIALCEGDDYWMDENKLSIQIGFLEANPQYSGACTTVKRFDERTSSWKHEKSHRALPSELDIGTSDLLNDFFIYTPTFVFRNNLFDVNVLADYSFGDKFIQLLASSHGPIRFINEKTAVYRIQSAGAMHTTIPANPYKFYKDYYDFLTYFDRYTNFEFETAITRKKQYLRNLWILSDRSKNALRKSFAGLGHLLHKKTEKSFNEVRNVAALAFPRAYATAKRLLRK